MAADVTHDLTTPPDLCVAVCALAALGGPCVFDRFLDRYRLDGRTPVPEPCLLRWGLWLESAERHVADTTLPDGTRISTVFLGLDHNLRGIGAPLLYESKTFGGTLNQQQERYATWGEAAAGHAAMVERLREEHI